MKLYTLSIFFLVIRIKLSTFELLKELKSKKANLKRPLLLCQNTNRKAKKPLADLGKCKKFVI